MDTHQKLTDELVRRQDNIDPIRRIPNGALFYGILIKGNLKLNTAQRIGAVFLGLLGWIFGCFGLFQIVAAILSWNFSDPFLLIALGSPLSLWFAWKITVNALINDPKWKFVKS